jgi:uncharacterized membrane protein
VYLLGFLGYVASHKELQCYNKEEISVKYMIPLIGVYEWYSWKFVILLTVLVVATFVVHRDEIEWCCCLKSCRKREVKRANEQTPVS